MKAVSPRPSSARRLCEPRWANKAKLEAMFGKMTASDSRMYSGAMNGLELLSITAHPAVWTEKVHDGESDNPSLRKWKARPENEDRLIGEFSALFVETDRKAAPWSGKSDSAATVFASWDDAEEEADKKQAAKDESDDSDKSKDKTVKKGKDGRKDSKIKKKDKKKKDQKKRDKKGKSKKAKSASSSSSGDSGSESPPATRKRRDGGSRGGTWRREG